MGGGRGWGVEKSCEGKVARGSIESYKALVEMAGRRVNFLSAFWNCFVRMCVQWGGGAKGRDFFILLLKEVDCKRDVRLQWNRR